MANIIDGWSIQSSAELSDIYKKGRDLSRLASMTLLFSDNLATMIDQSLFTGPGLYREELVFTARAGQRYFLEMNGVTSKADLYLNGQKLASKDTLVGAYAGVKFDITQYLISGQNAVLVRAYLTNYLADQAAVPASFIRLELPDATGLI